MKWLKGYRMRSLIVGVVVMIILSGGNVRADYIFGEPVNLGPTINSSINDGAPWISTDGLSLLFDRWTNSLGSYETFLTTRPTRQDSWDTPVSVGLSGGDPAVICKYIKVMPGVTTSDGLELYFSDSEVLRPGGYGGFDLYMMRRQSIDADWGDPVNLGSVVNSSADEIVPAISPDGLELYFSGYTTNVRPGGYGSGDLWVTKRATRNDTWTQPVNLGPTVNTAYQDARPRISADGLVLFFDSQRPGGYGSADLYMMRRPTLFDAWGEPVNLGPIINSSAFDEAVFPSADGSSLFFDSDRSGGYGGQDIHQAPIIPIIDLNGDGIVDAADMCIVINNWGENYSLCDVGPTPLGDGVVDVEDLKVFAEHLFEDVDDPTLIAHWRLDEAQGDIAYNNVTDCDGALMGGPMWQPDGGVVIGALQFDGVDDYVSTDVVLNSAVRVFSVVTWIKGGSPGQVILSQMDKMNWLCIDPLEGTLMTELRKAGRSSSSLGSEAVITDSNWHRIGFVWDGSYRRLYVDGVIVAEDAQDDLDISSNGLYFGTGKSKEPGTFFSGLIDDIRIYNRAVSP